MEIRWFYLVIFLFLFTVSNSRATTTVSTLNDSSTTKNFTFTISENKTAWITLPKLSNVINAQLNLSGYSSYDDLIFNSTYNSTENSKWFVNFTKNSANSTQNKQTGDWFAGVDGFLAIWDNTGNDDKWISATELINDDGFHKKINYTSGDNRRWMTIETYGNRTLFHVRYYISCGSDTLCGLHPFFGALPVSNNIQYFYTNSSGVQSGNIGSIEGCSVNTYSGGLSLTGFNRTFLGFNSTPNSIVMYNFTNNTALPFAPKLCTKDFNADQNTVGFRYTTSSQSPIDIEFDVIITNATSNLNSLIENYVYGNYPTNPYLDVSNDGDTEWSFSGSFNQVNNRTSNFSSEVQSYLSTCTPDTNGYCNIPLILHSDTAGIIQLSAINITYIDTDEPVINSTRYAPDCIVMTSGVEWNWQQYDDSVDGYISQSYCNFTDPAGIVTQTNSLTTSLGTTSCTNAVISSGVWSVKIVVSDYSGHMTTASYGFPVHVTGECAGGGGGGGGGGGVTRIIEVPVCPSGQQYNTETKECELLPVELLPEKPKFLSAEEEFLKPRFNIPYFNYGISLFHITMFALVITYIELKYPHILRLKKKRGF